MNENFESAFRPRQLLEEAKSLAITPSFLSKTSGLLSPNALKRIENKERALENARLKDLKEYSRIDHVTTLAVILIAADRNLTSAALIS